jgi:GntR family transcriptional regulator / MocR family aminotransferase
MKRVAPAVLPLIAVDRKSPTPLHRQIYNAYRAAIVGRTLRPGQALPSTRALASELGISRIPVLTAYEQLLAEGYFESRVGAGTSVSSSLPEQVPSRPSPGASQTRVDSGARPVAQRCSLLAPMQQAPWVHSWGPFGISQLALEHFPFQVWSKLMARHYRTPLLGALYYGDPMGMPDFRKAIATYLRTSRAVHCEAEQIMVVSGSQQALEISTRVLLDSGSPVWVEEPGYRFARDVLALAGCKLIPVPVDEEGLNVAAGIQRGRKARAAYVTPSHQYPLGVTMSASRRLQLLDWSQRAGAWIIEDDYDSEYRYGNMPIASLQGMDRNSRVIYIGTFSKVLFPSLRLGYIVVPQDLVTQFRTVRVALDLSPPQLHQAVLADFIRDGHFARHLRRMRQVYGERRRVLVETLRNELNCLQEVVGDGAGLHLTAMLKKGFSDRAISASASRQNLWAAPLSGAYLGEPTNQGLVLGFGSTRVEEIPRAVRKLQALCASV